MSLLTKESLDVEFHILLNFSSPAFFIFLSLDMSLQLNSYMLNVGLDTLLGAILFHLYYNLPR